MARAGWTTWGKLAAKAVLGVAVAWYVGRHVVRTWRDLRAHQVALHVEWAWLAIALAAYLVGLSAFGLYFGRLMRSVPNPVGRFASWRAYLVSHLGKYVPGKAVVVVLRVGLLTPHGARAATAAFATLYETLTMMAAGGLIAAVGFALAPLPPLSIPLGSGRTVAVPLVLLSLALGAGFLILVEPRVFPRLSGLVRVPFPNIRRDDLPGFSHRLLGEGLVWSAAGWTLLGLSQVAVVRALAPSGVPLVAWPQVIASVALATVAGFVVAIFPGGLVVREGVLIATLSSLLGDERAVVAALALRLVWVAGELLAAGLLTFVRPPVPEPVAA